MADKSDIMTNISSATTLSSLISNINTTTAHNDGTIIPPQPIDPALRTCNYFVISTNKTVVFDFNNHYGGENIFFRQNTDITKVFEHLHKTFLV